MFSSNKSSHLWQPVLWSQWNDHIVVVFLPLTLISVGTRLDILDSPMERVLFFYLSRNNACHLLLLVLFVTLLYLSIMFTCTDFCVDFGEIFIWWHSF